MLLLRNMNRVHLQSRALKPSDAAVCCRPLSTNNSLSVMTKPAKPGIWRRRAGVLALTDSGVRSGGLGGVPAKVCRPVVLCCESVIPIFGP